MQPERTLARLAAEPARAALIFDVDGTLAPIVARPEDARVPDATRALLERLASRFALVACISGRPSEEASRIVGVPELVYVGTHGLELSPEAQPWRDRIEAFAATVDWPPEWVENKGLSLALHYRRAPDPEAARGRLELVATHAEEVNLRARFGRMVLELLPPVAADKGSAVTALLSAHTLARALYAGDDTTDLDAFRALDRLELGVRVAVASTEAPAELVAAADIVAETPAALADLLAPLGD
ncbi:MAG: trehalose-phosphatase [Gaiellaceae bacterium]